ncbi:MAG: tetratricopeptide repeat protein [Candidatus Sumerlaeia bacterium]|nr:tetratricopeptide repeat protein [Candidatus Sumerlaeia bacterium]
MVSLVEAIAYRSIVASFKENPKEIERCVRQTVRLDREQEMQGGLASGCADNLAWLWAESLAAPEARFAAYELALTGPADPRTETSLKTGLKNEPRTKIRDTRSQDRWDRWADIANAAGHNLGRLLNGQFIGVARFLVELIYSPAQFKKVTERERKEWYLIDSYLRANPQAPGAEPLRARLAKLEARFRRDAAARCMEIAHHYADRGWWPEALFYVKAAERAGYTREKKFRKQVLDAVAQEETGRARSLMVADTERFLRPPLETTVYDALLLALARGDRYALYQAVGKAAVTLADTSFADEVQDAFTVYLEWVGDRRRALAAQAELAVRFPEEQTGRAALARLSNPQFNPRARFDAELARYRNEQWNYVLGSDRTPRQNIELLSEMVGPVAPQLTGIGIFFVTDVLLRSIFVSFGNPVSPEDVLTAGELLLADPRAGLTPDERSEISVQLGVLYQKLGRYEDAAAAYRKAQILSPVLDDQLAERAAEEQWRRIREVDDPQSRLLLTERLTMQYPRTKAAARAREELAQLQRESRVDFEIPYDWIAENPLHWASLGARLPPELTDRSRLNGEMSPRGLVFWRDFPSSATYVLTDGRRGYINVTPRRRAILRAAAEAWADEKAALEEGEIHLATRRLPFEIRGSAGMEGLIVFPTLRRAPLTDEERRLYR